MKLKNESIGNLDQIRFKVNFKLRKKITKNSKKKP